MSELHICDPTETLLYVGRIANCNSNPFISHSWWSIIQSFNFSYTLCHVFGYRCCCCYWQKYYSIHLIYTCLIFPSCSTSHSSFNLLWLKSNLCTSTIISHALSCYNFSWYLVSAGPWDAAFTHSLRWPYVLPASYSSSFLARFTVSAQETQPMPLESWQFIHS